MVQTEAIPTTYEKRFALKGQCKSFVLLGRGQGTRVCAAQQHPIVVGRHNPVFFIQLASPRAAGLLLAAQRRKGGDPQITRL